MSFCNSCQKREDIWVIYDVIESMDYSQCCDEQQRPDLVFMRLVDLNDPHLSTLDGVKLTALWGKRCSGLRRGTRTDEKKHQWDPDSADKLVPVGGNQDVYACGSADAVYDFWA